MGGYPPKEIPVTSEADPISKLFSNGDTLTVEQTPSPISNISSLNTTTLSVNTNPVDPIPTQQVIPPMQSTVCASLSLAV